MAVSITSRQNLVTGSTARRRLSYLQDALLVCVSALFFYAHGTHALQSANLTNVFFAVEQGLLVGMFLFRRRTTTTSQKPWDWFVAAVGGWLALTMRPHEADGLAAALGSGIQLLGLTLVILCFLSIGKSFGVVAANRGLKVHGPYRIVRHPIYFSHSLTQLGFVIANPWWPNVVIFATVLLFQVFRLKAEERVLLATGDYNIYRAKVRWRLIPGLY